MKSLTKSLTAAIALSAAVVAIAPAAFAQQPLKLFPEGDMVRGNSPLGATGPICVLNSQFKRGENVVFRIRVRNVMGQFLDQKGIKSITVELSDGQKFNARYGGHPPRAPEDFFWTAAWMIPKDFPTGTFGYKVTVTDMEGNTQVWEPIKESRGWVVILPQIAEYTKPDTPPAPAGTPTR
jgi:hypothetical protein